MFLRHALALTLALALPLAGALAAPPAPAPEVAPAEAAPAAHVVEIKVQGGYRPDRVEVPAGVPVVIRFVRTEYAGCTREVVFPSLGLRHALPTDQPVEVALGVLEPGEIAFHCAMNMFRGTVVVRGGE